MSEIIPRFRNLPKHMRALPLDHRGFPVPWFVAWVDGVPHFPVVDARRIMQAWEGNRCWVCGGLLTRYRASVIGPMCAITRTISEPQSHVDCARFSAKNCPFLSRPSMGRVPEAKMPGGVRAPPGDGLRRNPGAVAVWIEEHRTHRFSAGNGWLFQLGEPSSIEWYAKGRTATRAAIKKSIKTGLPLLREACDREPPGVRRTAALSELAARVLATEELLPT